MSLNYLLSLVFIILSCVAIQKILNFIKFNKLKNTLLLYSFAIVLFVFCVSYSFEIVSGSLKLAIIFHTIEIIALSVLPGFVFLIFFDIARRLKKVKSFHYIIIFTIPIISIFLTLTSQYHSFFLHNYYFEKSEYLTYLTFDKGFWFYVASIYNAVLMILLFISILKWFKKAQSKNKTMIISFSLVAIATVCIIIKMQSSNSAYSVPPSFYNPVIFADTFNGFYKL